MDRRDYRITTYQELDTTIKKWAGEIAIFGAGRMGRLVVFDFLSMFGAKINYYFDNHIKPGTVIKDGISVKTIQYLQRNANKILVFVGVKLDFQDEILSRLNDFGVRNIVIIDWHTIAGIMESIEKADVIIQKKYGAFYDDRTFLLRRYEQVCEKKLDLDKPKCFNEKLQWLKLYNRKSEYIQMVDKLGVKEYVSEMVGEKYVIPTIAVWDEVRDVDIEFLPDKFVLKCTHDSGSVCICEDKQSFDIYSAKQKLSECLNINFFWMSREWPYKGVKRKIFAEQYICEERETQLRDYKLFCFAGKVKLVQVDIDRFTNHRRNIYDTNWKRLPFAIGYPMAPEIQINKPVCLNEMIDVAEKLAAGIPHVRIDFYVIEDKPLVGEMTFFHGSGFEKFNSEEWELTMGNWIDMSTLY